MQRQAREATVRHRFVVGGVGAASGQLVGGEVRQRLAVGSLRAVGPLAAAMLFRYDQRRIAGEPRHHAWRIGSGQARRVVGLEQLDAALLQQLRAQALVQCRRRGEALQAVLEHELGVR